MQRLLTLCTLLIAATVASAGPVLNGDFETNDLSGWGIAISPTSGTYMPTVPKVVSGSAANGIAGPSGMHDDAYAVLDSTLTNGNPAGTDVTSALLQGTTYAGASGVLEFRLTDFGDTPPPTIDNNHSAMLLDNIQFATAGGVETLTFNWYALTKADQARNDLFSVLFNGNSLWQFGYTDALLPLTEVAGGGGKLYGPFSYGTGWQTATISQAVPEPGTWALLLLGSVGILRRRRR